MNEKTKKILSGAVFLSLVLGFFPRVSKDDGSVFNSANQSLQPFAQIEIAIAQPAFQIIPAANLAPAQDQISCRQGTAAARTIVQDQALINLNQPGKCFDLAVGSLPQSLTRLGVKPLIRPASKVAVLPFAKIAKVLYRNSSSFPASAENAIPPVATAVFFLISTLGFISIKARRRMLSLIKQVLSPEQLQVMRC